MMDARCRCCLMTLVVENGRCKFCGAYVDRLMALAMQEVRERETVEPDAWWRDDDRAWSDYRDEQADRLAVARGVA